MDQVLARVKGKRKKQHFKLISDEALFDAVAIDLNSCVAYNPDHNLDEDSWFKIDQFSQQAFCIDLLKKDFDSKDFDDLTKDQFSQIAYLFSVQGDDFYFQKITPRLFIKRKTLVFGEAAQLEESENRLVVNPTPDAVYFKKSDTLIFRNLATISSIFKGIDELYKEATNDEVGQFLDESFIELANDYDIGKVSKPNRKRIALAMATLASMSDDEKSNMLGYVNDYCHEKLKFDGQNKKFEISTDDELKFLLYGIEQRFYTTPFGREKRIANSVQPLD
ncbi:ATP F0F1 synthase synthase [Microbulbifer sp. SH-1]|uniref:ATP F0F1 synthase synthase n=1 Tax=Microbulbifer sp. SH-1 TaxID=2681547 RepID=UPI00140A1247|nr:ATP F0F1 synthase synthase [Microbulbifer sp. SH-1]QIL90347.1 ATP F0F1 synthase synthase [Microbulbifer sp. SH-1]